MDQQMDRQSWKKRPGPIMFTNTLDLLYMCRLRWSWNTSFSALRYWYHEKKNFILTIASLCLWPRYTMQLNCTPRPKTPYLPTKHPIQPSRRVYTMEWTYNKIFSILICYGCHDYGDCKHNIAIIFITFPFDYMNFFIIYNICIQISISKVGIPASS